MPRIIPVTEEQELHITCNKCGTKIGYYMSEVHNGHFKCPKCSVDMFRGMPIPNHMMVTNENGRPTLRLDIGLCLSESDINDPQAMLSACVSFTKHVMYPLNKMSNRILKTLPKNYHQPWW